MSKSRIPEGWQPTDAAIEQLAQLGIDREFALGLVPEFYVFWSEVGTQHHAWSGKFIKHALHEWRRYEILAAKGQLMIAMHDAWQPTQQVVDTLQKAGIPARFTRACVPEFRIYWTDQGTVTNTWNTRFLGHVRYRWINRHVRMPYGYGD